MGRHTTEMKKKLRILEGKVVSVFGSLNHMSGILNFYPNSRKGKPQGYYVEDKAGTEIKINKKEVSDVFINPLYNQYFVTIW